MGTFTELNVNLMLDAETLDEDVKSYCHWLKSGDIREDHPFEGTRTPSHAFFQCHRWMLIGKSGSYYFAPYGLAHVKTCEVNGDVYLTIKCDLKNYDSEIQAFLDWIYPYCYHDGFVGYYRYEEDDDPTLIYFDKDLIRFESENQERAVDLEMYLKHAADPNCRQCDGTGVFMGNVSICSCVNHEVRETERSNVESNLKYVKSRLEKMEEENKYLSNCNKGLSNILTSIEEKLSELEKSR